MHFEQIDSVKQVEQFSIGHLEHAKGFTVTIS